MIKVSLPVEQSTLCMHLLKVKCECGVDCLLSSVV